MTGTLALDLERIEVLILAAAVLFYAVLPLWAARDGIAWNIRRGTVAIIGAALVHQIAIAKGIQPGGAFFVALVCGWVAAQMVPARSRHIPTHVKRRVIREYESRTGKKYNPREVELDHIMPFSRGGSHTADNLRAIEKAKNRRKGAKRPGVRDWL
jgi:hypothetical protein